MIQEFRKLITDMELPATFSGLHPISNDEKKLVVFCDCTMTGNHLKLIFTDVHAFMVHEEFSHPNMDNKGIAGKPPKSEDSIYFYPALEVENSLWRATFPDYRLNFSEIVYHYQLLSLSNILDVLFSGEFDASYLSREEFAEIKNIFLD
ncbi:MAG: hypothetical protein KTR32_26510 [Granulosicoccus sp.]|nr:hypothetical protein [Granulosicoccus sp.]